MFFSISKFFLNAYLLLMLLGHHFAYAADDVNIYELSFEELLNLKVSTVSRQEQSLDESPAFIEIITQDDIKRRGYKDLSYLLDDIAGVQVTRTFGDNYFNALWRGVRHTIGSSHLILIDGIKFNNLYNNEAEIMAAFPLSNIKQVEVVHGPASVAYGNDAVVGIINIITNKDSQKGEAFVQVGENSTEVIDFSSFIKGERFQLRFSGRFDKGGMDMSNADNYRWTNPDLLVNTDIWGGFSSSHGEADSKHSNKSLEFSMFNEKTEITLQYHELSTGYGLEYTFDHSLPNAGEWIENEHSIHWKEIFDINNDIQLKTLLRYRSSNIDANSFFIDGYVTTNPETGDNQRLLEASYWEATNYSWIAGTELIWQVTPQLNLLTGFEYEGKNLQKAYNIEFGPLLAPEFVDSSYEFPVPPTEDSYDNNRIDTNQQGLYLLSQYQLSKPGAVTHHHLHFGIRNDYHSVFGSETSIRTGYVGQWQKTTFKMFYGQAYQEPSARLLYGGWQGSGSDPDLQPRNAETIEMNINYQLKSILLSGNYFRMDSKNLFNTTENGALNAGKGLATGGDVRVKYQTSNALLSSLSLWGTYSWLNSKEQTYDEQGGLGWSRVGDLADYTIHGGAYITFNQYWQLNIRGRFYSDRKTVETNELDEVESYFSLDANIIYQPKSISRLKLAIDVTNLLDEDYFHPGVRSASASSTNMGGLDENGVWIGSGSFYNAKIPQPGREIRLTAYWQFR